MSSTTILPALAAPAAAAGTGVLAMSALIVAIGAQNVFVLRQGLRREHVGLVIAICAASDAVLLAVGIAGLERLTTAVPWLVGVMRVVGAVFLLGYAALAVRRAWRPTAVGLGGAVAEAREKVGVSTPDDSSAERTDTRTGTRVVPVVATTLALTWLNPHVYLDTVFLLGSLAAAQGDQRWWFGLGATLASAGWFCALGLGARHLGRWLRTPRAWRVLDGAIAVVMVAIALGLLLG